MAESTTEVRIVRCPKCQNLLQEPKDCSFFKCGGCGTILCAKNKDRDADSVSVKSVEDRAKETQVNSASSAEEESDSDTSVRHQEIGKTETWDVQSDPCSKLDVVDSGNNKSGLDRIRKRMVKRCESEGFRFSESNNYFPDSLSSDEVMERDRAGLVRKLDKLKEQLLLKPKELQIPSSSSGLEKAPLRFPSSGKHVPGPSYYHHQYPESPCRGLMHNPAHVPAYGDPLRSRMHERTMQPSHPHYSRQYIGNNGHDLFDTHSRNEMFHQSTCSCFHCYDPYHRASGSVFPPSGLPDVLHNTAFTSHERSLGFGSSLHSPRSFIPPPPPGSKSRGLQLYGRCRGGFGDVRTRVRPTKAVSSSSGSRLIHPLAGGAPFLTCKDCFKLLKLPDKIDSATRKQQRLRCGNCSCLIGFSFVDKKLVLSSDAASARKAETQSKPHRVTAANFSSDENDNAAYSFYSMDARPSDVETGRALNSDKAQEMQIAEFTSPNISEDELSSDSPTVMTLTPDLDLHKDFDHSSINVRDRSGPRSRSSRSEHDRVTMSKTAMRQNSMREASVAIEMDVNDYSHNSGVSQDSANEYREDQGRTKKSGFASIVKNSFKDLKKSIQNNEGRSDVTVNGHLVAERLVKIAEKQAGPIRPGNYWYDYRAGFWGVMGGQCLGILPPFIEELNYPIPENCAGGNTRVYVNGRELHQKDLRLLTARGLPRDKDRSYTVYISGRVIDIDTGEELDSLGKLAPTVDKLKRGFGMRVPRRAA